ncbi:PAS domain-containing sensor histidine kinase [Sulfitobacter sp. HNIBRBA3233]|uniref:sensor histidine kinase n=1 Tax=Sulfitobacter marinivivus TaxID=3158558 RepID=UPI0032DEEC9F
MAAVQNLIEERIDGDVAKAMLGQSPQCIKLLDPDGALQFMSENGKAIMEIDDFAPLEGTPWWSLWPEQYRETLQNAVRAASGGVTVEFEAECPTASGTPKHWAVRVSPISGGELDGMIIAASEDISAQVALRESQLELESENLALRRFGRFVAHDLRGPIRQHCLLSEMIVEAVENISACSEASGFATQIHESANSLLALLGGLENLHMIETAPEEDRVSVPLHQLIAEARAMLDLGSLAVRVAPPALSLHANREQMVSVFFNLFDNALKYGSGPAGAAISVRARLRKDGPIEIEVSDTGPGFPADRREDVFQPLVRQSNSSNIAGSGLGLALVARIVAAHGGTVDIAGDARAGSGATIRIVLPQTHLQQKAEARHG